MLPNTCNAHLLFRDIFTANVLLTVQWFITLLSKNCCNDTDHEFRLKVAAKYWHYLHIYCTTRNHHRHLQSLHRHSSASVIVEITWSFAKLTTARTTGNATELTQAKVNLISHIYKPLCSLSVNTIGLIQESYDMLTKLIQAINHPQMQCRGWIRGTWCTQFLINSSSINNQPFRPRYRELRNIL
jgi:hypothetical protein